MFEIDKFYQHNNSLGDAVIRAHAVKDIGSGFEMTVTWHCLSYHGGVYNEVSDIQFVFISKDDAKNWDEYTPKERI